MLSMKLFYWKKSSHIKTKASDRHRFHTHVEQQRAKWFSSALLCRVCRLNFHTTTTYPLNKPLLGNIKFSFPSLPQIKAFKRISERPWLSQMNMRKDLKTINSKMHEVFKIKLEFHVSSLYTFVRRVYSQLSLFWREGNCEKISGSRRLFHAEQQLEGKFLCHHKWYHYGAILRLNVCIILPCLRDTERASEPEKGFVHNRTLHVFGLVQNFC